jgi:hypothetical protein
MGERRGVGGVAVAAISAALLGACTSAPPAAPARPSPPSVVGSILALTRDLGSPGLVRLTLERQSVSPVGPMWRNPPAAAAATAADGAVTIVAVARNGVAAASSVAPGSPPHRIGPAIRTAPDAAEVSVAATSSRVLVADCERVRVLDATSPAGWTDVGGGCWATLSPDGSRAAYSPDGRRILEAPAAGGRPRSLVAVGDLPDLGGRRAPQLFGVPAWGSAGLAFSVTAGDQAGLFLRRSDGSVDLIVRERLLKTVRPPVLAWQPGGELLAVMDDLGTGGTLRLFDPRSGAERVIGLDALGFDGLVWSPDGTSVATMTSSGALLVVGTDERWRARVDTTWNRILAWTT